MKYVDDITRAYGDEVLTRLDKAKTPPATLRIKISRELFPNIFKHGQQVSNEAWDAVVGLLQSGLATVGKGRPIGRGEDPEGLVLNFNVAEQERALRRLLDRPKLLSAKQLWIITVGGLTDDYPLLAQFPLNVKGFNEQEVVKRLLCLPELFSLNVSLRQLSAQLFAGNSKVFDDYEPHLRNVFSDSYQVRSRKLLLNVHLPECFEGILFVENKDTFDLLLTLMPDCSAKLAIVMADGYKASSEKSRHADSVSFFFSSASSMSVKEEFLSTWFDIASIRIPVFIWTDLDPSGMDIIRAVSASFPNLDAWCPGFEPMLAALLRGDGHSLDDAGKTGQRAVKSTGIDYVDNVLIPAIEGLERYLDQEWVVEL